uniref:RNase III domain-containing protein n=1 Tax=viral metagenome TaxID=1070528 RepID=A0A6C0ACG3_9ZZZZ
MSNNINSDEIDETIVNHILNPKNRFITKEYINDTLKKYKIKHKVRKLDNFIKSTIHLSYMIVDIEAPMKKRYSLLKDKEILPLNDKEIKTAIPLQNRSYERIEFLGDSIIRAVLSEYFYQRYTVEDEGFLTKLRTKVEKGESLARLCKVIGLHEYIIISKYIEEKGGREQNSKIQEDVFEGFIGALHLDGGYQLCKDFIINLIEQEVDLSDLLYNEDNYKDMLLQLFHKKKWGDPKYELISESGNGTDVKREFTMSVATEDGKVMGVGTGTSKKKGEQEAAKKALEKMDFFDESDSELDCEELYEYNSEDLDDLEYLDTESE